MTSLRRTTRKCTAFFAPFPWENREQRRDHWVFFGCMAVIFLDVLLQIVVQIVVWSRP